MKPIKDKKALDVNSIHYILASVNDLKQLLNDLIENCKKFGIHEEKLSSLYKKIAYPNRFDNQDTIFIKRMLQVELPERIRNNITHILFKKYVKKSEVDFCNEIYMSIKDLEQLVSEGMYIGNHSYNHYWLNSVSFKKQHKEIKESLKFLGKIQAPTNNWIMCYPYGAYNKDTISILKKLNCIAGMTTKVGVARLSEKKLFELSRFDTNDFPQ